MSTLGPVITPLGELRAQILSKAVVHGKVILSSGREADYYVDLRRVTLDHEAAPLVGRVKLPHLKAPKPAPGALVSTLRLRRRLSARSG